VEVFQDQVVHGLADSDTAVLEVGAEASDSFFLIPALFDVDDWEQLGLQALADHSLEAIGFYSDLDGFPGKCICFDTFHDCWEIPMTAGDIENVDDPLHFYAESQADTVGGLEERVSLVIADELGS